MPQISVVIPVYNGEKTIRETIASVLNQTFTDFELIVIDDGSQDATPEILASLLDPRVKVFAYPNAGPSASRNRGIALAHGEYIAFLDADDLWLPDKLQAQWAALQATPTAAVAYSWTDYIDESGQYLSSGGRAQFNDDVFAALVVRNFIESGSNPLVRADALRQVGDFDVTFKSAEDWDMWLRLAAKYHFVAVPSLHILYRRVASSNSGNVLRQEAESLRILDWANAQAPELRSLKRRSLANIYTYLTVKSLEGPPKRTQGVMAAKFLWKAIKNDPSVLGQVKYMLMLLFKIATATLLPPHQAQALRKRGKSLMKAGSKESRNEA